MIVLNIIFFFFKQKTAYEMRISDWSSDVCSSDLGVIHQPLRQLLALGAAIQVRHMHQGRGLFLNGLHEMRMTMAQQIDGNTAGEIQITLNTFADQVAALASDRTHIAPGIYGHEDRKRVVAGKIVSILLELVVRRIIKKKT